jgi:glucose-6-phosphate dehydrogenase assembly protein OpcA
VPGQPERLVALKRRSFTELISEELRRMDPDVIYERTVKSLLDGDRSTPNKSPAKKASRKRADSTTKAARQPAGSR